MRGSRFIIAAVLLCAVAGFAGAPAALADGGTPQDICNDLKDGVVNGSYTAAEWTAFFSDPTIQGYGCGGAVTPPTTPPVTPPTTPPVTPPASPPVTPPTTPPVTPPTSTPPAPVTPATPAVPLTPTPVVTGVKGAQATVVSAPAKPTAGVQGANHTVRAPVTKSAAAPIATTKSSGTLPFTGAQLSLFLLVGLALVATGLLLRSTARPKQKP